MGERWAHEEVITLLDLCIDQNITAQMDGKKMRNQEIFNNIRVEMLARNINKTVHQIQIKFKKLKGQYISIKKDHSKSGGGKIYNIYWDKLEILFGNRPRCTYTEECGYESSIIERDIEQTPAENANLDAETSSVDMQNISQLSERSRGGRNAYGKALSEAVEKWEKSQKTLQTEYLKEQERLQLQQQQFEEKMALQDQQFLQGLFQSYAHASTSSAPFYYLEQQ